MNVGGQIKNNVLTIFLNGELDESSAEYFRNSIDELCINNNFDTLVYDISGLTFMDSTGIGVLIGRYKNLKNRKIKIFIKNPNRIVDKIFIMAGLYEIMPRLY